VGLGPTLNVGVRRPFSTVNGSATSRTALANSKPLSWYNRAQKISKRSQCNCFTWIEHYNLLRRSEQKREETCASFPTESISARTAALALGSAQSCLKSSHYMLEKDSLEHKKNLCTCWVAWRSICAEFYFEGQWTTYRREEQVTGMKHSRNVQVAITRYSWIIFYLVWSIGRQNSWKVNWLFRMETNKIPPDLHFLWTTGQSWKQRIQFSADMHMLRGSGRDCHSSIRYMVQHFDQSIKWKTNTSFHNCKLDQCQNYLDIFWGGRNK
jgi:hypothetical protein